MLRERRTATSAGLTPPLKWHRDGGKHDLATWIISLMPARCRNPNKPDPEDPGFLHYCEPYFGGGAVLLANNPEGISEVVNDKNADLMNFWHTLQSQSRFDEFRRIMEATPFSDQEWIAAAAHHVFGGTAKATDLAVKFFIRCRQSLAGRMDSFAPRSRSRTRQGMNEQVSAWLTAVEGLPAVHARLMRVLILNDDALTVIRKEDGPRTLFYLDPPYLHETRATTGEYEHEMSADQHRSLLETLCHCKGRFLLSGYRSEMYDFYAARQGWRRYEKAINNHAASGKTKRVMTECVWTNY